MNHSEHFTSGEMACRDWCGFGTQPGDVGDELLDHLELMRFIRGDRAMWVTSGCRCDAHNAAVGGVQGSAHTRRPGCTAADLAADNGFARAEYAAAHVLARAVRAGAITADEARSIFEYTRPQLGGFGVARSFIHTDVDQVKPRPAVWSYS